MNSLTTAPLPSYQTRIAKALSTIAWTSSVFLAGVGLVAACKPSYPEQPSGQRCMPFPQDNDNVYVLDLPGPDQTAFYTALKDGPVILAYTRCSLRVLPQCRSVTAQRGAYRMDWAPRQFEQLEIRTQDELAAKLPLWFVDFNATLQKQGALTLKYRVHGAASLQSPAPRIREFTDRNACQDATHAVTWAQLGEYYLYAGAASNVGGSTNVPVVGAGAGAYSNQNTASLRSAQCTSTNLGEACPVLTAKLLRLRP